MRSGSTTSPLGMLAPMMVDIGCSKCGVAKKSGKSSCCARGGAWFKNCGDADDKQFDHTWAEGIQACEGIRDLVSVKSPPQVMLRHVGSNVYPVIHTTKPQNTTRERTDTDQPSSVSNVGSMGSAECVKVAVCICISFPVIINLRT